jgi:hypothetical protein
LAALAEVAHTEHVGAADTEDGRLWDGGRHHLLLHGRCRGRCRGCRGLFLGGHRGFVGCVFFVGCGFFFVVLLFVLDLVFKVAGFLRIFLSCGGGGDDGGGDDIR